MPKLTNAKVNYFGQVARTVGDDTPGVYALIDYYTAIFENECIAHVIDWVGLDPSIYSDDFYQSMLEISAGYDNKLIFNFENVKIDVMASTLTGIDLDDELFFRTLPKIRLEISGSGLMYLRRHGIDVDHLYREESRLLPGQHITRMDFAYDLINYKPELLDQLMEYCRTAHTASGRIIRCTSGGVGGSAISCEIKDISQKTVYLGASSSDRMLRVYDKRLQHIDRESGIYNRENPYGNPNTWIRIEMQTRNRVAHELGLDGGDLTAILREIYKFYCFADPNTTKQNRKPAQFWQDLFNWDELDRTIQNIKFVIVEDYKVKVDRTMDVVLQSVILWLVKNGGYNALDNKIKDFLRTIQNPDDSRTPLVAHRRLANFMNRLKLVLPTDTFEEYFDVESSFLSKGNDGKMHLREYLINDTITYAYYYQRLKATEDRVKELEKQLSYYRETVQTSLLDRPVGRELNDG